MDLPGIGTGRLPRTLSRPATVSELREHLGAQVPGAAAALLGALLVRDGDAGRRRVGRIVEVEAYDGATDRASHARFGRTLRNASMFEAAGTAYVYLVYGMHQMLNVAAGPSGEPAAILVRAVEPIEGQEWMRAARAAPAPVDDLRLASGPGLVTACFDVDRTLDGSDLLAPGAPMRLEPGGLRADERIATGPRVGIDYAGEPWSSMPWRFSIAGHPAVSTSRVRTRS